MYVNKNTIYTLKNIFFISKTIKYIIYNKVVHIGIQIFKIF